MRPHRNITNRKKEEKEMKKNAITKVDSTHINASVEPTENGKVVVKPNSYPKKYVVSYLEYGDEGKKNHVGIVGIYDSEDEAERELWNDMICTLADAGVGCFFDYRHISFSNIDFWWYINEIAA